MEHLIAILGLTAAIIVWYFVTRASGEGDDSRIARKQCKTCHDKDECDKVGSEDCDAPG